MTSDDEDDATGRSQDQRWAWLLGAGAVVALTAAWLGSRGRSEDGEMTAAKALKILQQEDGRSPESREKLAKVMSFYSTQKRLREGSPVDEYTKALDDLEAQVAWDFSSDGHRVLEASKRILAMANRDLRAMQREMGRHEAPPDLQVSSWTDIPVRMSRRERA